MPGIESFKLIRRVIEASSPNLSERVIKTLGSGSAMVSLFAVLIFVACTVATVYASAPQTNRNNNRDVDIFIETSRSQPTVGTGLSIQAEITNTSLSDIYMTEKATTIAIPPELQGPAATTATWWGTFPTQHVSAPGNDPDPFDGVVVIKPGDDYRIVWSTSSNIAPGDGPLAFVHYMFSIIEEELNFIFFTPGDYNISVIAQYWTKPDIKSSDYHTTTQTATLHVGAPQSVILFGAAIGGLIAYYILPSQRRQDSRAARRSRGGGHSAVAWLRRLRYMGGVYEFLVSVLRSISGFVAAMLLSAIVTILLARISETQFLIRITVADFWGAIAVGFVANYFGARVFDRMIPVGESVSSKQEHMDADASEKVEVAGEKAST